MFRPQRFSHSRRFSPSLPCGLVSSHYHVRDSLFREFPQQPAELAFADSCPPTVGADLSCNLRSRKSGRAGSRHVDFRALDPIVDPWSPAGLLGLPTLASLLSFGSLGVFSGYLKGDFAPFPLLFLLPTPHCGIDSELQRFDRCPAFHSVSRASPRSSFVACLP
jgi:hypothetical protein